MYIEQKSIEELQTLIQREGYHSGMAEIIGMEFEYAKRQFEKLIQEQDKMPGWNKEAECVVRYYLFQLQQLRYALPYDAMGGGATVPLLILAEFQKQDIAEQIEKYIKNGQQIDKDKLRHEIQKFITVQLDPRGIVLYMDILEHCKVKRKRYMSV